MKASEFRKLIREEVKKTLNEGTQLPKGATADQIVQTIQPILDQLEKDMDDAVKGVSISVRKRPKVSKTTALKLKDIAVMRKGVSEVQKLNQAYKDISHVAIVYTESLKGRDKSYTAQQLAKLNALLQQYGL
jgi:hypothetical protein